ncbi:hypothetical protein ABK040_008458 [Willaertia magna]
MCGSLRTEIFITNSNGGLQSLPFNKPIKSVSSGNNHIGLVTINGDVYMCGQNNYGQCGVDMPGENCNEFVKVEGLPPIKSIQCGGYHTFLISNNNECFVTGRSTEFQTGLDSNLKITVFTKVKIDRNIKFMRCGKLFSIFLMENNEVYGCGNNEFNQLDDSGRNITKISKIICSNIVNTIIDIQCGSVHTLYLDNNGNVYGCGNNLNGELGIVNKFCGHFDKIDFKFKVKKIACSSHSSFVLSERNELYATGDNYYGQLGLPFDSDTFTFTKINYLPKINEIHSLAFGCLLIDENYFIYATGDNTEGQLGLSLKDCLKSEEGYLFKDKFTKLDFISKYKNTMIKDIEYKTFFITTNYMIGADNLIDVIQSNLQKQLSFYTTLLDISIIISNDEIIAENENKRAITKEYHIPFKKQKTIV